MEKGFILNPIDAVQVMREMFFRALSPRRQRTDFKKIKQKK